MREDAKYFRAQAKLCFELARYLGDKTDANEARERGERYLLRAKEADDDDTAPLKT
jgi:hypothetical protein